MRSDARDTGSAAIRVVSICFFLAAFVFPVPVYAVGEIVSWGDRKLPDSTLTSFVNNKLFALKCSFLFSAKGQPGDIFWEPSVHF